MDATKYPSPLVVIVGETASGKSDLAIRIAQEFNGEIISADSWTVRRYMDIGTAKPTLSQQLTVPHHLLDIVEPNEDFTAAVFKRLAMSKIDDISKRGKLPIVVGGTGLYIDALIYDYGFLSRGDRKTREELNNLSNVKLLEKIHNLQLSTANVDTRNKRRLIRLIEANGERPTKKNLRLNTLMIGINTDRDQLRERIEKRVDAMLRSGLESEVKRLAEQFGWKCEGMKGVGYAQWQRYFEGTQSLVDTRLKIIKATQDLAKKQRTWFKRNKSIHWLYTPVNWLTVVELVTTNLHE